MSRGEDIAALLAAHAAPDPDDRARIERCRRLCEEPFDPCARTCFGPGHFTASALVLAPDAADLLLVAHRTLGRWLQPGGHFEAGDPSVAAAVRREIAEETGLVGDDLVPLCDGLFDVDIHAIPARGGEPEHEHFDLRLAFRARHRALPPGGEGARRWFPAAEVLRLGDPSLARAVRRLDSDRRVG